ncbi:MAG: methionyl-tRNA formyltransferase [Acidobacteriota bacterium]
MRVIFFGTPDFAVPTLEALAAREDLRPALVVTQPGRPVGRGRRVRQPPVAVAAEGLGLPVAQPEKASSRVFVDRLRTLWGDEDGPDAAVVVAFGQIFRRRLLELPRHGCINLHASLLPRYRGAAPIQAAVAAGDPVTGVTTMRMGRGLDTGPMLLKGELPIGDDETAPELAPRLAELGAGLMVETLRGLEAGTLEAEPQDDARSSYAPRLQRQDGEVDWRLDARRIYDRWRAYTPWPGLMGLLRDEPVKLVEGRPRPAISKSPARAAEAPAPGTVLGVRDGALEVSCGGGTIFGVERLQRPGKKALAAPDFANGERLRLGERFAVEAEVGGP